MTRPISRVLLILLLLLSLSTVVVLPAAASSPGDLDITFDTDGKVITDFSSYQSIGQSVAIQSDGKIVVAGISMLDASAGDFALARYNADGSLDTSFDTDGKVTTSFGSSGRDQAWGVAIQTDGKIVVAGDTTASGLNVFALARYNADGSLDSTFDTDGKVTTNFALPGDVNVTSQALSVAIQSDGKIVAAGNTGKGFNFACFDCPANNGFNFALARYNADGSLDTSFGGTGKVITDIGGFSFGGGDAANSVAIQSDGKIVAAGHGNPLASGNSDFALVRYNTDGTLDTSFDSDGKVTTNFGTVEDYGYSVAIQSDDKIVVAGQSGGYPSGEFALARYNTDGSLDSTFDSDGKVTTNLGGWDFGQSVAIQNDGGIVAAGYTISASFAIDFALARYNTNGSLDTSFDTDGKVTTDFGGGPDAGHSVAIQGDGKIVVAGHGGSTHTDFAVARYAGTVPASNSPPTADADGPYTVNEGSSIVLDGTGSSDADVDPLTYAWDLDNNGSYEVSGPTPTFAGLDGLSAHTVVLKVCDPSNACDTDTSTVTVNNVAPTVNAGADQSLPLGSLVNISAAFTDPGANDIWTYSIDWGGGSPADTGNATVSSPITGSHQYVVAGNQSITVCVTDDDLGEGCDSLTVTFVSGIGKVTGGALRFGNNGRGGFNVQSNDGVTVKGELEYHNGSVNLHAHTMTAVAVSPDRTTGWFSGVLVDGRTFVAYVEDNGEPGKNDIFKLWIEGVPQNGDGKLTGGNVQIHK